MGNIESSNINSSKNNIFDTQTPELSNLISQMIQFSSVNPNFNPTTPSNETKNLNNHSDHKNDSDDESVSDSNSNDSNSDSSESDSSTQSGSYETKSSNESEKCDCNFQCSAKERKDLKKQQKLEPSSEKLNNITDGEINTIINESVDYIRKKNAVSSLETIFTDTDDDFKNMMTNMVSTIFNTMLNPNNNNNYKQNLGNTLSEVMEKMKPEIAKVNFDNVKIADKYLFDSSFDFIIPPDLVAIDKMCKINEKTEEEILDETLNEQIEKDKEDEKESIESDDVDDKDISLEIQI